MLGTIFGNVSGITLGIGVGTELGSFINILLILKMTILRDYFLETHWVILMVKCLALYLEM